MALLKQVSAMKKPLLPLVGIFIFFSSCTRHYYTPFINTRNLPKDYFYARATLLLFKTCTWWRGWYKPEKLLKN